jgi:hypothetical protein
VWGQNFSLTGGSCTMTVCPPPQHFPSESFWRKKINHGPTSLQFLTVTHSLWFLPHPFHVESSQGITFWNVKEIRKILMADLNSSLEIGFWNCYNNAGICV